MPICVKTFVSSSKAMFVLVCVENQTLFHQWTECCFDLVRVKKNLPSKVRRWARKKKGLSRKLPLFSPQTTVVWGEKNGSFLGKPFFFSCSSPCSALLFCWCPVASLFPCYSKLGLSKTEAVVILILYHNQEQWCCRSSVVDLAEGPRGPPSLGKKPKWQKREKLAGQVNQLSPPPLG